MEDIAARLGRHVAFDETGGADLRPQYDLISRWLADTPAELVADEERESDV